MFSFILGACLGTIPRSGIGGSYGNYVWAFRDLLGFFPKWLHHFTFTLRMYESPISPHPHQHLLLSVLLITVTQKSEMVSPCVLICIFLKADDVKQSFHVCVIISALVVQLLSHIWLFSISWTAAHQASLPFTISQSLLKPNSIESVMPSSHVILCCFLLLMIQSFPPWGSF